MSRACFRPTRPDMTLTPAEACRPFNPRMALVPDGSCIHWRQRPRGEFRRASDRASKARWYREEKLRVLRGEA